MGYNDGFSPTRVYQPFWRRRYQPWIDSSSYSGCDIIPVVYGIDATTKSPALFVLGNVQTFTYSIHSEIGAVKTLGRRGPKGITRGPRTIAGSIIFSVFDRRALWELAKDKNNNTKRVTIADELPGFDVILYFSNEYGEESTLIVYDIHIGDEGQSHSIEDVYIENTMSYMATGIDLLQAQENGVPSTASFISNEHEISRRESISGLPYNYTYVE
jgi:hypothetical protein